jgi:hypothetical protein
MPAAPDTPFLADTIVRLARDPEGQEIGSADGDAPGAMMPPLRRRA